MASKFHKGHLLATTLDGVVPVSHSEGGDACGSSGGHHDHNNLSFVLSVLSGWASHPNVAAVLAVEDADASLTWEQVQKHADAIGRGVYYPPTIHTFTPCVLAGSSLLIR